MTNRVPQITSEDYQDAVSNDLGWCPVCQSFTRECTEPDAEGYDCELCGEEQVIGAELGLMTEAFELTD